MEEDQAERCWIWEENTEERRETRGGGHVGGSSSTLLPFCAASFKIVLPPLFFLRCFPLHCNVLISFTRTVSFMTLVWVISHLSAHFSFALLQIYFPSCFPLPLSLLFSCLPVLPLHLMFSHHFYSPFDFNFLPFASFYFVSQHCPPQIWFFFIPILFFLVTTYLNYNSELSHLLLFPLVSQVICFIQSNFTFQSLLDFSSNFNFLLLPAIRKTNSIRMLLVFFSGICCIVYHLLVV